MSIKNPYLIDGYTGMKSISWILEIHAENLIININIFFTMAMGPKNNVSMEAEPSNTNITCKWKR